MRLNALGTPKEKRTQLRFRDDGKFTFRKMYIEDTFLVEKIKDIIIKGWKHFYKLQFPFPGGEGIPADMVTLAFDRDIILDPYNILDEKEKPSRNRNINDNPWITEVAEGQRYKAQNKPKTMLLVEKITMFIGIATLIVVIGMAARGVWG